MDAVALQLSRPSTSTIEEAIQPLPRWQHRGDMQAAFLPDIYLRATWAIKEPGHRIGRQEFEGRSSSSSDRPTFELWRAFRG